ncbi:hypothetical protein KC845_00660 [Candidatus Kaiserbacteria bacterium]|nr:hypothetical protein [Candidatus Kaiserbacteria bacterium]
MEQTAKNFALQLGAIITLYVTITSLIVLLFNIINILIPDVADYRWQLENSMSGIRFSIATLVVFMPAYLTLTRIVNKARRETDRAYLNLTKWLIYLSLLAGGLVLLGNFVATVYTFLNGEITLRFILKALSLFIVVGAAVLYYWLDAKHYWQKKERLSIYYGILVATVSIVAMIVGYTQIDTPSMVREMKIDQNQITDLQNIQWKIEEYIRNEDRLPESINEAYGSLKAPVASDGRSDYIYRVSDKGFELCAEFKSESGNNSYTRPYFDEKLVIQDPDNWDYVSGEFCFERVVNIENE